jgi:DNA-binding response OmpR family regulator
MKILIIEDEATLAQSMATYLKGENYLCELAPDCRTALEKIDNFDYDCILLDISLSDGNGMTILKELKANKKPDGVIIISARNFGGNEILNFNELLINLSAKTVSVAGVPVDLTRKEYDLLLYLASNKNRVISKNAIAEHLWGEEALGYDNLDFIYSHMKNLKRKLHQAGCSDYIRSMYGMGYKFESPSS